MSDRRGKGAVTKTTEDFGCNSEKFTDWGDETNPEAVLRVNAQWTGVTVYKGGPGHDDGFTVYSDDYVANDWATWHASLPDALRQAADIIAMAVKDQDIGYQTEIATVAA